jgi:hypothetical protein
MTITRILILQTVFPFVGQGVCALLSITAKIFRASGAGGRP